jgi:hypothetical protein
MWWHLAAGQRPDDALRTETLTFTVSLTPKQKELVRRMAAYHRKSIDEYATEYTEYLLDDTVLEDEDMEPIPVTQGLQQAIEMLSMSCDDLEILGDPDAPRVLAEEIPRLRKLVAHLEEYQARMNNGEFMSELQKPDQSAFDQKGRTTDVHTEETTTTQQGDSEPQTTHTEQTTEQGGSDSGG